MGRARAGVRAPLRGAVARLDPAVLLASARQDTHFYVCGPERLIEVVRVASRAAGVEDARVHFEHFSF
jgi:ferredoxin-NADP reductase